VTKEGVWIQPSASHLKKLLDLCGLDERSKPRETPITKEVATLEPSEPLQDEEIRRYGAIVEILMYISTDRPDTQYGVNELAMCMASPTKSGQWKEHVTWSGTSWVPKTLWTLSRPRPEGCDVMLWSWLIQIGPRILGLGSPGLPPIGAFCTRSRGDNHSSHKAVEKLSSMPRQQELARAFCSEKSWHFLAWC